MDGDITSEASVGPQTLVAVQAEEESVNQIIMVLESNTDIVQKLRDFYHDLLKGGRFPIDDTAKSECGDAVKGFTSQLDEIIYDLNTQIARARVLSKLITDRKNIVSLILVTFTKRCK